MVAWTQRPFRGIRVYDLNDLAPVGEEDIVADLKERPCLGILRQLEVGLGAEVDLPIDVDGCRPPSRR